MTMAQSRHTATKTFTSFTKDLVFCRHRQFPVPYTTIDPSVQAEANQDNAKETLPRGVQRPSGCLLTSL